MENQLSAEQAVLQPDSERVACEARLQENAFQNLFGSRAEPKKNDITKGTPLQILFVDPQGVPLGAAWKPFTHPSSTR